MAVLRRVLLRHVAGVLCAFLLAPLSLPHAAVRMQETLENDVKAAFLFNFTKFVDWPPTAFESPTDPLRVCAIADAVFIASLDRIIAGETVRGRALRRVVPDTSELPHCHLLYIGGTYRNRAEKLMAAVGRAPVLTVGETSDFLTHGGTIAFVLENQRVRFDVNLRAAERAQLTISSKLLRVAREIQEQVRP